MAGSLRIKSANSKMSTWALTSHQQDSDPPNSKSKIDNILESSIEYTKTCIWKNIPAVNFPT